MVVNVHERTYSASARAVGALIDTLASDDDRLWPVDRWPRMRFDRGLSIGASGGHGPIRYAVDAYVPGRHVRFRFEAPAGFHGYHEYLLAGEDSRSCTLRHRLVMSVSRRARVTWPLVYRPLHDALIEDSLDRAARSLGLPVPAPRTWSRYVRALRAIARRPLLDEARGATA